MLRAALLFPPFFFFFFLKDSDASGLAPAFSMNQFKGNKCGILSRSVCSPVVCKALVTRLRYITCFDFHLRFLSECANLLHTKPVRWTTPTACVCLLKPLTGVGHMVIETPINCLILWKSSWNSSLDYDLLTIKWTYYNWTSSIFELLKHSIGCLRIELFYNWKWCIHLRTGVE